MRGTVNALAASFRVLTFSLSGGRKSDGSSGRTHGLDDYALQVAAVLDAKAIDLAGDGAGVSAPTLVVTGEPSLDHVVPTSGASEYVRLIAGACGAVLERTGHIGSMTRPDEFAALVREFVMRSQSSAVGAQG